MQITQPPFSHLPSRAVETAWTAKGESLYPVGVLTVQSRAVQVICSILGVPCSKVTCSIRSPELSTWEEASWLQRVYSEPLETVSDAALRWCVRGQTRFAFALFLNSSLLQVDSFVKYNEMNDYKRITCVNLTAVLNC